MKPAVAPLHLISRNYRVDYGNDQISQYKKYQNTLCLSLQTFAQALFPVSLGTIISRYRKYKQCLCKILEGQTKSIMVFLIVVNKETKRAALQAQGRGHSSALLKSTPRVKYILYEMQHLRVVFFILGKERFKLSTYIRIRHH